MRSHATSSLTARGVPASRAAQEAASISQFQGGSTRSTSSIPHFIRLDFAHASRSVFYAMAIFMAVAAIALVGMRSGRQEEPTEQPGAAHGAGRAAGEDDATAVQPGRPARPRS
jgi:hypothetical protein